MVSKSPLTWHRVKVEAALLLLGGSKSPGFPLRLLRRVQGASCVCSLMWASQREGMYQEALVLVTTRCSWKFQFLTRSPLTSPKGEEVHGEGEGHIVTLGRKEKKVLRSHLFFSDTIWAEVRTRSTRFLFLF